MAQTAEAQAFLKRLNALPDTPGIDLASAIKPSLEDEEALRRLFATDRANDRLSNPVVGLVDVFGENTDRIKKIHARQINEPADRDRHHLMPLDDKIRRKDGDLSMAGSLEDFKARWAIFSEGALSSLTDWSNVVVAGGSVLACLAPLPPEVLAHGSKRAIRKYYHSEAFPASDVDLFIYGLSAEQVSPLSAPNYDVIVDLLRDRRKQNVPQSTPQSGTPCLGKSLLSAPRTRCPFIVSTLIGQSRLFCASITRPPRSLLGSMSMHPASHSTGPKSSPLPELSSPS